MTFLDIPREFRWFDGIRTCVACVLSCDVETVVCMLPSIGRGLVVHECVAFFGTTLDVKL